MKTTTLLNLSLLLSTCGQAVYAYNPTRVTPATKDIKKIQVKVAAQEVKTSAGQVVDSAGNLAQDVADLTHESIELAQQQAALTAHQAGIAAEKIAQEVDSFATHTAVTAASQVSQAGKSIGYYAGQAVAGAAQLADSLLYPAAIYFSGKAVYDNFLHQHVGGLAPNGVDHPWGNKVYHWSANLLTGALAYTTLYSVATSPEVARFIRTNMPHTARILGHALLEEEALIQKDVVQSDALYY